MLPTPASLSRLLNDQAERTCRHLFPNGKRVGHEWVVGDIHGNAGQSLKIVLDGPKTGVGSDFATGQTYGDFLDVWQAQQGCTLSMAMSQCCSFLGIALEATDSAPSKVYKKPSRLKSIVRLNKEGDVYKYLKSRGMTDECLESFRVAEDSNEWIVFPHLREGIHVSTKYINIRRDENNKKIVRNDKDTEPCLYGWQAIDKDFPSTRFVVLTEGHLDCMTYHQCGIPALSVPNGGGSGNKQNWIDTEFDRMSRFDMIYLSMDNDSAGKEAEEEIVKRLGPDRCRIITLPYKDANECFQKGISHFRQYLLSSKILDPVELKPADYFEVQVLDKFYPKLGSYNGMKTPWKGLDRLIKFDRQELIIWTGFSGSGKSQALNQIAIQGLMDGEKFVIASLEVPPRKTLWRLVRQISGEECPNREMIKDIMRWLGDKLWIFNLVGTAKVDRLLEVFRYGVRRYMIQNFTIDSMLKVGISEESFDQQKDFIDKICDFNTRYDATTHLVVHQRKPSDNSSKPGKFGVRGASAITDEASTVITVYRNDEVEQEGKSYHKKKQENDDFIKPNSIISVEKNREEGEHGKVDLWFNKHSLQLLENPESQPIKYWDMIQRKMESFDDL